LRERPRKTIEIVSDTERVTRLVDQLVVKGQ